MFFALKGRALVSPAGSKNDVGGGRDMTYTVIGVYEDNLQGGCFHVEANSSTEAVAALERRDTPERPHTSPMTSSSS